VVLVLTAACTRGGARCDAPPDGWVVLPPGITVPVTANGHSVRRIVAFGSSSTYGIGASDASSSYPAELAIILQGRYPELGLEVLNRGVSGNVVADNMGRLRRDVLEAKPDLVIWQVGTNDALYGWTPDEVIPAIKREIFRMRAVGATVVLMAPQPLPDEPRDAPIRAMSAALRQAAADTGTPYLDRYRLMDFWRVSGQFDVSELLASDGLHMTDITYRCLALRVADVMALLGGFAGQGARPIPSSQPSGTR
jgi:lysophospholipase L1-like esterase